jgi:Domain of unknown function (DUF1844)
MSKKQEQEFIVSDRRRFGSEGEVRTDVAQREDEAPAAPPAPNAEAKITETESSARLVDTPPATPETAAPATAEGEDPGSEFPEPPSEGEQLEQHYKYKASGKKLDEIFQSKLGAQGAYPEMTFEKVIESLYMSALIQMGAIRQDGETQSQIDIIGARQTIDSITVIHDKTAGNLSDRERSLIQNVLFELRMAWIELTNAIAARAVNPPSGVIAPPGVIPEPK